MKKYQCLKFKHFKLQTSSLIFLKNKTGNLDEKEVETNVTVELPDDVILEGTEVESVESENSNPEPLDSSRSNKSTAAPGKAVQSESTSAESDDSVITPGTRDTIKSGTFVPVKQPNGKVILVQLLHPKPNNAASDAIEIRPTTSKSQPTATVIGNSSTGDKILNVIRMNQAPPLIEFQSRLMVKQYACPYCVSHDLVSPEILAFHIAWMHKDKKEIKIEEIVKTCEVDTPSLLDLEEKLEKEDWK